MTIGSPLFVRRALAAVLALVLVLPILLFPAAPAQAQMPNLGKMSMGKKVLLIGGAALLFYLWKKHNANQKKKELAAGGATQKMPQLYRSKNGGIYYRDPVTHKPTWLTVPNQQVQVPADEVRQYVPNYKRLNRQPAPAAPKGYGTQSFSDFDPSVAPGPVQ